MSGSKRKQPEAKPAHDATNPDDVEWMRGEPLYSASVMQAVPLSTGAAAVTFGNRVGATVVPVATIVMPTDDATSIGASMLSWARRRRRK